MLFLYSPLGECFSFSMDRWKEVLANASRYGWKPAGTVPPAAPFDLDAFRPETLTWDDNYTRPLGQIVSPEDAAALAAAVERALTFGSNWKMNRGSGLRAFASFCRRRGFLISSNNFTTLAPSLHHRLAS